MRTISGHQPIRCLIFCISFFPPSSLFCSISVSSLIGFLPVQVACLHQVVHEAVTVERGALSRNQGSFAHKAVSLPSSPSRGQVPDRGVPAEFDMMSTWNRVLESSSFLNKPLLPFQDWSIDFSELTIGIRVGIGKFNHQLSFSTMRHVRLLWLLHKYC